MEQPTDTKQEVTTKFTTGIILIVISLALGKLVLIPLLMFPGSKGVRTTVLILYICAWLMLIPGVALAGWEGYRLVTHKYREYRRRTIDHVKNGGRKAAHQTKKVAKKTKHAAKKTKKKARKKVDTFRKDVLEADKAFQETAHDKKFM